MNILSCLNIWNVDDIICKLQQQQQQRKNKREKNKREKSIAILFIDEIKLDINKFIL